MAGKYLVGGAAGLVSYIAGNYYFDSSTPLHVKYTTQPRLEVLGVNLLPCVSAVLKSLPDSIRVNMLAKMNAPKEATVPDWFDLFGADPYKVEEVVPGKIWKVEYASQNFFALSPDGRDGMKMLGMDYTDEKTAWRVMQGAEASGREASAQALKDLAKFREVMKMVDEQGTTKETITAIGPWIMNMVVVKLNSGDLMLYCPVQVRDETGFGEWLDTLGPVKWVVLGSAAHTLHIPSILKRYPEAKYIGPRDAWLKLQHVKDVSKQKPDYEVNVEEELQALNTLLADEGVKFHFIHGDVPNSALVPIAHKTALEVDLIYSLSDGGMFMANKEEFDKYEDDKFGDRLFKWGAASSPTSPNNALGHYRFWLMDPTSPFSAFVMGHLKKDGSSCTDMAASLRKMLAEDFDQAVGVHTKVLTRDEFRKSIDINWNWLDGKSLLEDEK